MAEEHHKNQNPHGEVEGTIPSRHRRRDHGGKYGERGPLAAAVARLRSREVDMAVPVADGILHVPCGGLRRHGGDGGGGYVQKETPLTWDTAELQIEVGAQKLLF